MIFLAIGINHRDWFSQRASHIFPYAYIVAAKDCSEVSNHFLNLPNYNLYNDGSYFVGINLEMTHPVAGASGVSASKSR